MKISEVKPGQKVTVKGIDCPPLTIKGVLPSRSFGLERLIKITDGDQDFRFSARDRGGLIMSDRAVVEIRTIDGILSIYLHSGGETYLADLAMALDFGRSHWGDESYLTRFIVTELAKGNAHGLLGMGLTMDANRLAADTNLGGSRQVVIVDFTEGKVFTDADEYEERFGQECDTAADEPGLSFGDFVESQAFARKWDDWAGIR